MTLTISGAYCSLSSASMVSMLIKGLLLAVSSSKDEQYSWITSSSISDILSYLITRYICINFIVMLFSLPNRDYLYLFKMSSKYLQCHVDDRTICAIGWLNGKSAHQSKLALQNK